jgi:hypothetical protein
MNRNPIRESEESRYRETQRMCRELRTERPGDYRGGRQKTFPAGYDITVSADASASQLVVKNPDSPMRQLKTGAGPRRNDRNASETGATRDKPGETGTNF